MGAVTRVAHIVVVDGASTDQQRAVGLHDTRVVFALILVNRIESEFARESRRSAIADVHDVEFKGLLVGPLVVRGLVECSNNAARRHSYRAHTLAR